MFQNSLLRFLATTIFVLIVSFDFAISAQVSNQQTPAAVVKAFYQELREKRFREALMMTNWRSAVESLTPQESEDLRQNFGHLAAQATVEVTSEQISGATTASVFVKGKDPESGEMKIDEVKLRRENNAWIIVLGDEKTEEALKREGKNYFFKLWMENRHTNVQYLLEDLIKA